jgi:hypothetical protein
MFDRAIAMKTIEVLNREGFKNLTMLKTDKKFECELFGKFPEDLEEFLKTLGYKKESIHGETRFVLKTKLCEHSLFFNKEKMSYVVHCP